ncbi:MAG: fatty acid desaturase [Elusimicrobiota bacterium]
MSRDRADLAALNAQLARYVEPDTARSLRQLLGTSFVFVAVWGLAYLSLDVSYWATSALILIGGGFLLRLSALQHDCGHGALFKSKGANDWVGRLISVATLTPYYLWLKNHAVHHANVGNLDLRGEGYLDMLTVKEYEGLSAWKKLVYRCYRAPFTLFLMGPAVQFIVLYRLPWIVTPAQRKERLSILGTDLALALVLALMSGTIGVGPFLLIHLSITAVAASAAAWLFYIQHQFKNAYWERDDKWDFTRAGMEGCSYYKLPSILQWITCSVGLHHIHHLSSRIPNYNLQRCMDENVVFQKTKAMTFRESLKCPSLKLWDEERRRMVGFPKSRTAGSALSSFLPVL